MEPTDAKQFLISRVIEEAEVEGVVGIGLVVFIFLKALGKTHH